MPSEIGSISFIFDCARGAPLNVHRHVHMSVRRVCVFAHREKPGVVTGDGGDGGGSVIASAVICSSELDLRARAHVND